MSDLTINLNNFHILENLDKILIDVKNLTILHLPENYELVLKSYKNLENIKILCSNNSVEINIILEDLENLNYIKLFHSKISLTLNEGLNKLEKIESNIKNNIIDNCNYLENIKCYNLYINKNEDEHIILDDRFKNVTELECYSFTINLELKEFPRLKILYCEFCNVYGKSKFPLLEKFTFNSYYNGIVDINITDLNNFFLVNSELPSLKEIIISGFYINKNITKKILKLNNVFTNLETLIIIDTNIEFLDFKVHDNNPIIKHLELNTKIKVSGSLCKKFPKNVRNDYQLILPMRKNPNNIF